MLATSLKYLTWFVLLLTAACSRAPAPLVDDLIEGMKESEVVAALGAQKTKFHVVYQTSLPKGDPRPPYSEKTISAGSVSCAGQLSEVSITFYLDQLSEITCYPSNVDALIDSLVRAGVIESKEREFDVVRGGVAVHGSQVDGRWGVTFSSKRLTAEQRSWIAKYS